MMDKEVEAYMLSLRVNFSLIIILFLSYLLFMYTVYDSKVIAVLQGYKLFCLYGTILFPSG